VLAPPAAHSSDLYRPSPGHQVRARLALVANRRAPVLGRAVHAVRLARAGRLSAAAWVLGLRRNPPLRSSGG
jgi:hypothetical protein